MTLGAGEVFAGYTIVEPLGAGGMGEVYLAGHPRLPRREALKVLRPDISNDAIFRARFIREADSVAALDHPNIVTVHDRGEYDGRLWIATQYIDGADAAEVLRRRYPAGMPAAEALPIITAIAEALDYAHNRDLIHRDVKPANILLAQPGADGTRRAYLADFGIARPLADSAGLTATAFTLGTVAYAAPEQLLGRPIDGRADQYALAATAYHLLTGTPVFPTTNPVEAIDAHLNTPPPPLAGARPDLAALDPVMARALSKNPADRYPRCGDFARALSAADLAGADPAGPTTARPTATDPTMAAPTPSPPPPRPTPPPLPPTPPVPAPPAAAPASKALWVAAAAIAVAAAAAAVAVAVTQRQSPTTAAPAPTPSSSVSAPAESPRTYTQTEIQTFTKTVVPAPAPPTVYLPPAAATAPTSAPSVWTGVVVDTCDQGGSCGILQRNAPYTNAPRLLPAALQDGTQVGIVCQTQGDLRQNTGHGDSRTWYRITSGAYLPAVYVITGTEGFPSC